MKALNCVVMILLIIGGLNWGSMGLFDVNFITAIFGSWPILVKIIYIVVGICAIYGIYMLWCKCCGKACATK